MRRYSKLNVMFILVLVLQLISLNCGKKEKVYKIGVILPLSGDAAAYGKEALNGVNLAAEEINEKGGISGMKIKLIVEDDSGTPKDGVSALNKILATNTDIQIIIGGAFSQIASAQIPICEKKGIVLFSPYASTPDLAIPGDCFFRNWPSDIAEGKEMAKYAFNELNLRRVAILSSNSDYGVGLKRVFASEFESLGGDIPITDEFKEGDQVFRTQLAKINNENVDAIYMVGWYKEFAKILQQAKELGLNVQFLSCVTFNKPEILELAGNAAEGVIFSQPSYSTDSDDPMVTKFVENYRNRFDNLPGLYAAQIYDAIYIISEASKAGTSLLLQQIIVLKKSGNTEI
jgi:branched-chain amino acid transport system substrate-binding protein